MRPAQIAPAVLLAALACSEGSGPLSFGSVRGVVLNGANGSTIAGVNVELDTRAMTTGSDGAFGFDRVLPGRYEVRATFGDFQPYADSIDVVGGLTASKTIHLLSAGFVLGAPSGIYVAPSEIQRSISVAWTPLEEAVNYALYWSTSPDVPPEQGTRIGGIISPFVHRELVAGQTYFYAVAAIGVLTEGPTSVVVSTMPEDGISIRIEDPTPGTFVAPGLPVLVWANSAVDVTSVVAAVGEVSVPLTFNATFFRWSGTITPPPSESSQVPRLIVTATDASGKTAQAMLSLRRLGPSASISR